MHVWLGNENSLFVTHKVFNEISIKKVAMQQTAGLPLWEKYVTLHS